MTKLQALRSDDLAPRPAAPRDTLPPRSGIIAIKADHQEAFSFVVNPDLRGGLELNIPELGLKARINRFNPVTMWFETDAALDLPVGRDVTATVEWSGPSVGPLRGVIIPSSREATGWCFQIDIQDLEHSAAVLMMELVSELVGRGALEPPPQPSIVTEDLSEKRHIRKVVNALSILRGVGTVRTSTGPMQLRFALADDAKSIVWDQVEPQREWRDDPFEVEVLGYNSVYALHVPAGRTEGGKTVTALPTRVRRVRRRYFRRCSPSSSVTVRFIHPHWLETGASERAVRDFSFGGISFVTVPREDIVFPGLLIPNVLVKAEGKEGFYVNMVVRSLSSSADGGQLLCGATVTARDEDGARQWIELIAKDLYPETKTSEDWLDALWELFDASGYFSLAGKTPADFEEFRASFFRVGRRAAEVPQLICQAVYEHENRVEGTISFLKAYETAWMGHQLAKRQGGQASKTTDSGRVLREVYCHSFEHPQSDPNFRWVVGYVEPQVRWVVGSHLDFVRRHENTGHVLARPVHMMSAVCAERSIGWRPGLEVRLASDADKALLACRLAETYPRCYVEAFDFVADRIGLESVTAEWRAKQLERERAIYFACVRGRPVAAGVFESGEKGTNLFRLLDNVRIFPLAPGVEGHSALLDQARKWFKARGRKEFLYFRENDDPSYVTTAKLHEISEPYLWIISAEVMPDFLEHVCQMSVGRPPSAASGD